MCTLCYWAPVVDCILSAVACSPLQKKRVAADLSAWEEAERKKAEEELQQMEIDAQLQAEMQKQEVSALLRPAY